jgi:sporulation and cell division protein SsgA
MNPSTTVSAELGLQLVVPQEGIVPLVASLYYDKDDPYAVRIAFHVGLDEPVEWTFGRELLATGVEGVAGLGDVAIWQSAESSSGLIAVLNIELSSPHGQARFEAPVAEVSDFLDRTYQIVPAGRESEHVDIEAGLTELLREAL